MAVITVCVLYNNQRGGMSGIGTLGEICPGENIREGEISGHQDCTLSVLRSDKDKKNRLSGLHIILFSGLVLRTVLLPLDQWCTTSGPRATSGPRQVLMWPAVSNRKSDYFKPRYLVYSGTA